MPLFAADPLWQAPPTYTPLEAIALFVGIPLLVMIVIALAVYAPGWIRGRQHEHDTEGGQGPLWATSPAGSMSAPSGPGILTPSGPTDHSERGGASGQW